MHWRSQRDKLINKLNSLMAGDLELDDLALDVFQYQARFNKIYSDYLRYLDIDASQIDRVEDIPALPIQAFKHHVVKSGDWKPEIQFVSSGTTEQLRSKHDVLDLSFYSSHLYKIFESFLGNIEGKLVCALLPSYLERQGASLVTMAEELITKSGKSESGFFLYDIDRLIQLIKENEKKGGETILLGVSFALLDLADLGPHHVSGLTIIETGGMKGRAKEVPKAELLKILSHAFPNASLYSEYGMTELMSQAYRLEGEYFKAARCMKIVPRQIADPLSLETYNRTSILQIIDLGNIDSCAFILTEDVGRVSKEGLFTIDGRLDQADLRGCHLMLGEI